MGQSHAVAALAEVVALLLLLSASVVHATQIVCGCQVADLTLCDGRQLDCRFAYFAVVPADPTAPPAPIRNVMWYSNEFREAPVFGLVQRAAPFPMGTCLDTATCSSTQRPVDLLTIPSEADSNGYNISAVSVTVTYTTASGLAAEPFQARISWKDPDFVAPVLGVERATPDIMCPAARPDSCVTNSAGTLSGTSPITWAAFATRVARLCNGATLRVTRNLNLNVLQDDPALQLRTGASLIIASNVVVTINFEGERSCGVVLRSGARLEGVRITGTAGTVCACNGTAPTTIARTTFEGLGSLVVTTGANVAAIQNNVCRDSERPCFVNLGAVTNMVGNRFINQVNRPSPGGSVHNYGTIGALRSNTFGANNNDQSGPVAEGLAECPQAAGVVLNTKAGSIGDLSSNSFFFVSGGAVVWNDGAITTVTANNFTRFQAGGIANGPTGSITSVTANRFTSGVGDAILNFGVLGSITSNTFSGVTGTTNGVIAVRTPTEPVAECIRGANNNPASPATTYQIFNNTITTFEGSSCGAIHIGEGATVAGNPEDPTTADSMEAAFTAPAAAVAAGFSQGVSSNTIRNGESAGPVGICVAGKVSYVARNSIRNLILSPGGAGGVIDVSGVVGYVGSNTISNVTLGEALGAAEPTYGAIQCGRPSSSPSTDRAVIKVVFGNSISGVTAAGAGGCITGLLTCAVGSLVENSCRTINGGEDPATGLAPPDVVFQTPASLVAPPPAVPAEPPLFAAEPPLFPAEPPLFPAEPPLFLVEPSVPVDPLLPPEPALPVDPLLPPEPPLPVDPLLPPEPQPAPEPSAVVCEASGNTPDVVAPIGLYLFGDVCPFDTLPISTILAGSF